MYRNRFKRTSWSVALMAAFLFLFWPIASWGQKMVRVTVKNKWVNGPDVAPFFLGMEKGYFAAEGINLEFLDGRGSASTLKLLGSKKILFGLADMSLAAKFISQGMAIKAVYGYTQTTPIGIIFRKGLGIRSPKDLEGKKVGTSPGSSSKAIFQAVAVVNGVDQSKIEYVNAAPSALNQVLLNRDVHATITYFPDNVPFLRSKGAKVDFLRYADFGVNVFGAGINVHPSVLTEKADTLRRLLRGLSRSLRFSINHPNEAVAALKKRFPLSIKNPEVGRQALKAHFTLYQTKNSEGKPLGWMTRDDWKQTVDILAKYGGLKNPLPPERYYTNEFVPKRP